MTEEMNLAEQVADLQRRVAKLEAAQAKPAAARKAVDNPRVPISLGDASGHAVYVDMLKQLANQVVSGNPSWSKLIQWLVDDMDTLMRTLLNSNVKAKRRAVPAGKTRISSISLGKYDYSRRIERLDALASRYAHGNRAELLRMLADGRLLTIWVNEQA